MLVSATLTASISLTESGFGSKDSESKTLENMENFNSDWMRVFKNRGMRIVAAPFAEEAAGMGTIAGNGFSEFVPYKI